MKTRKLQRRIKLLRIIRRWLGLNGLVQMSIFLQASKKITVEMAQQDYADALMEAHLMEALAIELIRADMVQIDKGTEGDDFIREMETWWASIKVIV